jgi:ethanolamine utilization protein EutA (predicted chaperonin)
MKRTDEYRFGILTSMLFRHERACRRSIRSGSGIRHDLSNVRVHANAIEVSTATGQHVTLTGSTLTVDGIEIPIESIDQIEWITQEPDMHERARQKLEHFDRLHVRHGEQWTMLDGLGQSVFAIMQFLDWAVKHG